MKLADYLNGMQTATTVEELEAAIQADFQHSYHGRTWSKICKVRIEASERIIASHPHIFYVPRYNHRRQLTVCGETYKVGRGQNSTGVRYVWHSAGEWTKDVLIRNGFSRRAANRLWDSDWHDYPHRTLEIIGAALAGKIPDPKMNVLIKNELYGFEKPINYTVEQNNASQWDYRATRPCECGGTLFDWGSSHNEGFNYISWYCNNCPNRFTEYVTHEQIREIRQCYAPGK